MSPYNIAGKRLLLVEDNPADAEYIAELLETDEAAAGNLVHVTHLGQAGKLLLDGQFDVVLLDLHLPDSTGVEGVKTLRAQTPDLPIVVLTGLQDHEAAFECIVAGAQDYLAKATLEEQGLRRALAYAMARVGEMAQRERADTLRETMAAIVEASSDAIVSADLDNTITSWNRGAERIFGYRREEALGQPVDEVMRVPDDAAAAERAQRVLALRRGEDAVIPVQVVCLNREGAPLMLSIMASALRDSTGRIVGVSGVCRDVTEDNRRDKELRRRNAQLVQRDRQMRELTKHLNAVREDERTRISREVHDVLGQLLTGLKMDLRWIDRRLAAGTSDLATLRGRLGEADQLANQTISTVQRIATELRPSVLDSLGLLAAARDEARRFEARTGVRTLVEIAGKVQPSAAVATALFRILQELLTNVTRHAGASLLTIELREEEGGCVLQVTDDGVGIPVGPLEDTTSLGLLGMRERAEAIGGSFDIRPGPAAGTVATVRVPHNMAGKG
jgi:two-component system, NarL family, sensor histidine kinase UhpB